MNRRELLLGAGALAANAVLPLPCPVESAPGAVFAGYARVTQMVVGIDYGFSGWSGWVLAEEVGPGKCRVLEVLEDDDPRIAEHLFPHGIAINGSVSL